MLNSFSELLNSSKPVYHVHSSPTNPCKLSGFPRGWNFARRRYCLVVLCPVIYGKYYARMRGMVHCSRKWTCPVQQPHLPGGAVSTTPITSALEEHRRIFGFRPPVGPAARRPSVSSRGARGHPSGRPYYVPENTFTRLFV